jgi:hypothetical protein
MKNMQGENPKSQIIIYKAEDGQIKIDVRFDSETVWLTQNALAELFQTTKQNVSLHIINIFEEAELKHEATVKRYLTVQKEGNREVSRDLEYYNLDLIIAIGYRVRSGIATAFRQWATARLKEYIIKGFVMDDDRLKNLGGGGHWKELLERIRDIRSSEKVFYRQILDIYATSIDYDANTKISIEFFKKVQNKVHYAVHGQTAAEVIYNRADAEKDFMGLATFSGAKPQLKDAKIAKNYLGEKELRALGQIVSGYLDFAERQAEREIPMKMVDWVRHLDSILTATGEQLLLDAGSVSHEQVMDKAESEYRKYQAKTLSSVEKAYLEVLETVEKKIKKKIKTKSSISKKNEK